VDGRPRAGEEQEQVVTAKYNKRSPLFPSHRGVVRKKNPTTGVGLTGPGKGRGGIVRCLFCFGGREQGESDPSVIVGDLARRQRVTGLRPESRVEDEGGNGKQDGHLRGVPGEAY